MIYFNSGLHEIALPYVANIGCDEIKGNLWVTILLPGRCASLVDAFVKLTSPHIPTFQQGMTNGG
jgi:hypothetical protein